MNTVILKVEKMSDFVTDKRIKKLELELKDHRQELQEIRERLKDLAFSRDRFGSVKMKEEPYNPF